MHVCCTVTLILPDIDGQFYSLLANTAAGLGLGANHRQLQLRMQELEQLQRRRLAGARAGAVMTTRMLVYMLNLADHEQAS